MKKLLSLLLTLSLLLVACVGCSNTKETPVSGTYTAVATGFKGDVEVSVTLTDSVITAIDVNAHETNGIGSEAIPYMTDNMLKYQTYNVDSATGATITSAAFKLAVKDALTQSGVNMEKFSARPVKGELAEETLEADIVVVGAGASGMMAAYYAAKEGYSVIVIDKAAMVGGASSMAGGAIFGTGSDWQKELGYEDSTEALKAKLMAQGHNKNDEATVDLFMSFLTENVNWILSEDGGAIPYKKEGTGATFSMGSGTAVTAAVKEKMLEAGAKLYLNTKADELIVKDGAVVGVKATGEEAKYTINAQAVILATGGYGHNTALLPEEYKSYRYSGFAGHDGDALVMVEAVDGATRNIPWVNMAVHSMILPSGVPQYTNMGYVVFNKMSGIEVNENGERYGAEVGNDWALIQAMKENERQYLIMDQANYEAFNAGMSGRGIFGADDPEKWTSDDYNGQPFYKKAATLEELAEKINVPAENLVATVNHYNDLVNSGAAVDEYGRALNMTISTEGPYYALEMSLRYSTSLGGICIDDNMQVLNTSGTPVQGLYAAGEVVGGVQGDLYLPSSTFTWAMTSGVQAGKTVSAALAK